MEMKQKISQILLLEILYVLVHASQNQNSFFPGLPCPKKLSYCPGQYAQEPWKGSDLPQASEMGHSF